MAKYINNSSSIEVAEDGDNISFEIIETYIFNKICPVGKTEIFYDNNDHSSYLGFTWERTCIGRVPVGIDSTQTEFDTIGETGGSKYLQEHVHKTGIQATTYGAGPSGSDTMRVTYVQDGLDSASAGTGNSGNLQPYQVVAFWKRVS